MSNIETYYLIDFENINGNNFTCTKPLDEHDHIHIFSTSNVPHISFESLSHFNLCDFNSHLVPAGNQSLDMHLISYLGYLIGKNGSNVCRYIIVSKDGNYDNIISFLRNFTVSDIVRQSEISSDLQKDEKGTLFAGQTGTAGASSSGKKNTGSTVSAENTKRKSADSAAEAFSKNEFNSEIMHAMSSSGYDRRTTGQVASLSSKHYGSSGLTCTVHNELRTHFPNHYLDIYKVIKPVLQKFSAATEGDSSTKPIDKIQKRLSRASYDADTISCVSSLVSKTSGKSNAKQTIYRELVAKYGQKKALNLYNHIKKLL